MSTFSQSSLKKFKYLNCKVATIWVLFSIIVFLGGGTVWKSCMTVIFFVFLSRLFRGTGLRFPLGAGTYPVVFGGGTVKKHPVYTIQSKRTHGLASFAFECAFDARSQPSLCMT